MADEAELQLADSEQPSLVDKQIEELQKITDYEIKEWPIGVLVEKFTNGRDLDESEIFIPDYQRDMVWTPSSLSDFPDLNFLLVCYRKCSVNVKITPISPGNFDHVQLHSHRPQN